MFYEVGLVITDNNPWKIHAYLVKDIYSIRNVAIQQKMTYSDTVNLEIPASLALDQGLIELDDSRLPNDLDTIINVTEQVEREVVSTIIQKRLFQRRIRKDSRPTDVCEEVPEACRNPRRYLSAEYLDQLENYLETFKEIPLNIDRIPPKFIVFLGSKSGKQRCVFKIIHYSSMDMELVDEEGKLFLLTLSPDQRDLGFYRRGILFYTHNIGLLDLRQQEIVL